MAKLPRKCDDYCSLDLRRPCIDKSVAIERNGLIPMVPCVESCGVVVLPATIDPRSNAMEDRAELECRTGNDDGY